MNLSDLQDNTYIPTDKLPELWKAYIKQIREKGNRTGILGQDKEDAEILEILLPRIKRNIDKMPAAVRNMFSKYAKTTRQYRRAENAKNKPLNVRVTDDMKKELQRISKGQGVGVSALVCDVLENYLAEHMAK